MKLSSILNESLVLHRDSVSSFDQAVELLARAIGTEFSFEVDTDRIRKSVMEREAIASTIVGNGVAIPHARIPGFEDLVVGLLILKTPLTHNEQPVQVFAMVLTSESASQLYLNTVGSIAQIAEDAALLPRVLATKTSEELLTLIDESGLSISTELSVQRIMSTDVTTVTKDKTVKDVINLMSQKGLSYMPVVSESGEFLGELNLNDVVKLGIPNYAAMLGSLSFLKTFEPFDELLKNEDKIFVRDVMKQPMLEIGPDASIIELAFKLSRSHKRHATVVSEGKVVGVVSLFDIVTKVLRG